MKNYIKLVLAGVMLLATSGMAHAETGKMYIPPKPEAGATYRDVVRDTNGNPIHSTNGNCVRTNWSAACDPCAPQPQVTIPLEDRTVYFDFNKSKLTGEAKKKLDALVSKMRTHGPIKSVRIAGYADRLGNPVYNEKLSKKRAEAVRKYLEAQGVANALVTETRWFGDTVPSTHCPKDMKRKELINCLARDRRVEVEVEFGLPGMIPMSPQEKMKKPAKAKKQAQPKTESPAEPKADVKPAKKKK